MPLGLIIASLIVLTDYGPIFYVSYRVGINNCLFKMPKFRTMKSTTPEVATHLLKDSTSFLTPVGSFLRKSSFDEIPQLYSILIGDMSLIGPRPALYNQDDLIDIRTQKGIHKIKPGLTGWAQVNGRDEITIEEKARLDEYYLNNLSFTLDLKIIFFTLIKVLFQRDVSH